MDAIITQPQGTTVALTGQQVSTILYYETGFEQLHPHIEIVEWMAERGWRYHHDWHCNRRIVMLISGYRQLYELTFDTKSMAEVFVLRWL